jgi:CheY-like chemotaxis protein
MAIRERPTLILLDILMPGGDGLTLLKRLKGNTHTQKIPVVIISAFKDPAAASAQGKALGAAAYLSKPITRADLMTAIEQALHQGQ